MAASPGSNWDSERRISAAQRWERPSAEMGRGVTEALVELSRARPGMRVLDVACGTGAPALPLARRVGPEGRVVAVDIAAEPLQIAARRAAQRGLKNVRFERGDVHHLSFPDDQFDLLTSRFGVMFFADLPRALAEMRRVLRPAGRVAIAAWGAFDQPYFRTTAQVVMRYTGRPLPPAAAAMFQFSAPGSISAAFRAAGFRDPQEEIRSVRWVWPDRIGELWSYFQAVTIPFRPLLEAVRPEQREAMEQEIFAALEKFWDGKQVDLTAEIVLASATK